MKSKLSHSDTKIKPENSQGASNDNELLKNAETNDNDGMLKYGIDLDDSMEK